MVEKRVGPSETKGRAQRKAEGKSMRRWKCKGLVISQKGKSAEGSERQETNTTKTGESQDAKQYKARSRSRYG